MTRMKHDLVRGSLDIVCECGWKPDWSEQVFRGWIAQYDEHLEEVS